MQSPIRAIALVPADTSPTESSADRVVLTYDERHRRRMRYVAAGGTVFLLDLPRAAVLRTGDALRLEDGRMIRIEAAPEALLEITAPDACTLTRLAWHIGNRHLPAQIESRRILIREDAVIGAMLHALGASVVQVRAPFTPEPGAYDTRARDSGNAVYVQGDHHHDHPHGNGRS